MMKRTAMAVRTPRAVNQMPALLQIKMKEMKKRKLTMKKQIPYLITLYNLHHLVNYWIYKVLMKIVQALNY